MPDNRFYTPDALFPGINVRLSPIEEHHLKVMRKRTGDRVELVNGKGELATAQVGPQSLKVLSVEKVSPPSKQVILAQALLKPKLLDFVIEKGTELGATSFYLFPGDRSEKEGLSTNQAERLTHLMISALKQCGRLYLPTLTLLSTLYDWPPQEIPIAYGTFSLGAEPLRPSPDSLILLIGPEGGLSPSEENHLASLPNSQPISLNTNILRAETAAICAISIANTPIK